MINYPACNLSIEPRFPEGDYPIGVAGMVETVTLCKFEINDDGTAIPDLPSFKDSVDPELTQTFMESLQLCSDECDPEYPDEPVDYVVVSHGGEKSLLSDLERFVVYNDPEDECCHGGQIVSIHFLDEISKLDLLERSMNDQEVFNFVQSVWHARRDDVIFVQATPVLEDDEKVLLAAMHGARVTYCVDTHCWLIEGAVIRGREYIMVMENEPSRIPLAIYSVLASAQCKAEFSFNIVNRLKEQLK